MKQKPLHPIARSLNESIAFASPKTASLLSNLGRQSFFPKGILTQAAEADEKAHRHNATLGIATDNNKSMHLRGLAKAFPNLTTEEVFPYASSFGVAELRRAWQRKLLRGFEQQNKPSISLPVATCGLTHGLSIAADLFFDDQENLITSAPFWGNYKLVFEARRNACIKTFPFYEGSSFNHRKLKEALRRESIDHGRAKLLLNLPNNPTGYQVTRDEAKHITELLLEVAEGGTPLLVLIDDAYVGFAYEEGVFDGSFFGLLGNLHNNLLAVNISGASKELYAWGLRLAFITFAFKPNDVAAQGNAYKAFEEKAAGTLRGSVSSVSMPTQQIVLKLLGEGSHESEQQAHYNTLKTRYRKVKQTLKKNESRYEKVFSPYPFNSGYFMLLRLNEALDAEQVRQALLEREGVGVVSIGDKNLRVAFSSVGEDSLEDLFERIFEVSRDLLHRPQ